MIDIFFAHPAGWFTAPALVGTLFFLVRVVLMLTGADVDGDGTGGDLDVDGAPAGDGGASAEGAADDHTDPDHVFKILSIQTITTFLMGFGWAGLGGLRGSGWDLPTSVGVGIVGGVALVWLLAWLLKAIYDLQSSGNVNIRSLQGLEGDVYITVPGGGDARPGGRGRVRVVIDNRHRFYPAVTHGEEIARGERIRIARVNSDRTVTVERA